MSSPENSSHGLQSTLIHLCITGTTSLFASFTMHVHVANNYNLNILLCTNTPMVWNGCLDFDVPHVHAQWGATGG